MLSCRTIVLAMVLAGLLLFGFQAGASHFSPCQYCYIGGGPTGQCLDVVNPNPSITTMSNCQGTQRCFSDGGGLTFCFPDCNGDWCYWV